MGKEDNYFQKFIFYKISKGKNEINLVKTGKGGKFAIDRFIIEFFTKSKLYFKINYIIIIWSRAHFRTTKTFWFRNFFNFNEN